MKAVTPRPLPRSSHSHSHSSSHSHSHRSKPASTPSKHSSRTPSTAAASIPSHKHSVRSPEGQESVSRSPSPNYFGLSLDAAVDARDSGAGPKENWSPPTSSIRSFSTQSPKHLPMDANPDFEAFRRQAEVNNIFSLSQGNFSSISSSSGQPFSRTKEMGDYGFLPKVMNHDESKISSLPEEYDPSRPAHPDFSTMNEDSTTEDTSFFGFPRHASPANLNTAQSPQAMQRNILSSLDDRHPRLSLPSHKADPPSPRSEQKDRIQRAETLPSALEVGPTMISVHELRSLLQDLQSTQYLLLDLRVAPQYYQSRIRAALNLCIPTTLLKRPSFNLEKLTDTFKIDEERTKFSAWTECKYIIVYDARSTDKKDATSAINTLRKFTNEGWNGHSCILRGGIAGFSQAYPNLIDHRTSQEIQASRREPSLAAGPDVAPVAGGCEIPTTKNAMNPFFSNIRQNMDLVGGVGQIELQKPRNIEGRTFEILPTWLQRAASAQDHGKNVSDKFLHIEQDELMRMRKALSPNVSYGTPSGSLEKQVQIAGFEKGGKNRYNNIWPFEHARVRLQGRPEGACDYVNASHIQSAWSNKRYIASQGPLPATFEDFWSVVWDQDVRVIVMLTAESEGGQLKCHPYWAAQEYGTFNLKALSEKKVSLDPHRRRRSSTTHQEPTGRRRANTTLNSSPSQTTTNDPPYVVVRKFALSHSAEPFKPMREITQLHYSAWPDFGAPAQPSHLLGLVELSNSIQRGAAATVTASHQLADDPEESHNARPILVHCSAGCGRTGTFCVVDTVIDMLKRQRKEQMSGVTPMDIDGVERGEHAWRGGSRSPPVDDWVFNGDVDLIEKTVEDFRRQRISMVQSLRQYVLCYETTLEWLSQEIVGRRERSGSESTAAEGSRS